MGAPPGFLPGGLQQQLLGFDSGGSGAGGAGPSSGGGGGNGFGGGEGGDDDDDDVHADLVPHLVTALQELLGPAAGAAAAAAIAPRDRKQTLTDLFQHQAAMDPSGTLTR